NVERLPIPVVPERCNMWISIGPMCRQPCNPTTGKKLIDLVVRHCHMRMPGQHSAEFHIYLPEAVSSQPSAFSPFLTTGAVRLDRGKGKSVVSSQQRRL